MKPELIEILACPACRGPLKHEGSPSAESLKCPACSITYQVANGIPDMLPAEAGGGTAKDEAWNAWSAKLDNFVQWRRRTWDGSARADKLNESISDIKVKFADFTALRDSSRKVLDIGCGDGGIRTLLGDIRYFGIDPLLLEGQRYDFPITKGVGERLPFMAGSFDEAILNQVLDHCNSIDQTLEEIARVTGDGSVNVMQFVFRPEGLVTKAYQALLKFYLSMKGIKNLDTKMRRFDMEGLIRFFRERFEEVKFLKYSDSQVFIKATEWKKARK